MVVHENKSPVIFCKKRKIHFVEKIKNVEKKMIFLRKGFLIVHIKGPFCYILILNGTMYSRVD